MQHAFVREFSKQSPTAMQMAQKNSERKVACAGEKDLDYHNHHKRRLSVFFLNLAKPKEIVTKNKSENPNSSNNSLKHPEVTLDNETLQAATRSGHNGRGQRKRKPN